ncbi:MAG: protein-glutamate O-methyltransferase CheR [Trueperaceae bacterium]
MAATLVAREAATMLSDPLAQGVSALLAAGVGLHFPANRRRELELGLAGAARESGYRDTNEYVSGLLSAPLTRSQRETLAKHLTVGETYFFRHPDTISGLEEHVLPELIRRRRQAGRYLRIWSAGCCTGEEPYTIAILLDRLIPDQRDWDISIVATDVNPAFLRAARAGNYGMWSFRGTPESVRDRYFRALPGQRFELLPEMRRRVKFGSLNLAEDSYPSRAGGTEAVDLILCRNVLMYFTREASRAALGRFYRSLSDGGWLALSATEAAAERFEQFDPAPGVGTAIFRRNPATPKHLPFAAVPSPIRMPLKTPPTFQSDHGHGEEPKVEADTVIDGRRLHDAARDHANAGRLVEAYDCCRKAVDVQPLNSSYRYLLATIELECGHEQGAIQALLQAAYLDPAGALPHVALGNLRRSQMRLAEAVRHFGTALRLLRKMPAAEEVADGDGLTAGRLAEMVETARAAAMALLDQGKPGQQVAHQVAK